MTLDEKEVATRRMLRGVQTLYRAPALAWSGGKDSMVLHHLCRQFWPQLPLIFFRESLFPEKLNFQHHVIEAGHQVFDWPPSAVGIREGSGRMDLVRRYSVGGEELDVSLYLQEPSADCERFACTFYDLIVNRPLVQGQVLLPWDVILTGSKSSDVDKTIGPAPLGVDVAQSAPGTPSVAFPLRHWTDQDVWDYTDEHGISQNLDRYDRTPEGWRERADTTNNSDHYTACTRCLVAGSSEVECPRLGGLKIKSNRALVLNFPWAGICPDKPQPQQDTP